MSKKINDGRKITCDAYGKLYVAENVDLQTDEGVKNAVDFFCKNYIDLRRFARKYLKYVPNDVVTRIEYPHNDKIRGQWYEVNHTIILTPTPSIYQMVKTFFHELIHSAQFAILRLEDGKIKNPKGLFTVPAKHDEMPDDLYWLEKGKAIPVENTARPFCEYSEQPHEQDARTRAERMMARLIQRGTLVLNPDNY